MMGHRQEIGGWDYELLSPFWRRVMCWSRHETSYRKRHLRRKERHNQKLELRKGS